VLGYLLRHDRSLVVAGLLGATLVSWAYLLAGAGMSMPEMAGMLMPVASPVWNASYFGLSLAMWAIMMAAMMLPSAAPMLLLYDKIARNRVASGKTAGSTSLFGLGYLSVWAAFSVAAVSLQYGLDRAKLLSPMMESASVILSATLLILAGVYQWTPLKQACLSHCRSPLEFIMTEWRGGKSGPFVMGLRHGIYCLGCCWVLMLLLFVGGIMNLIWTSGLAAFVLVEKTAPAGQWLGRAAGICLAAWGAGLLLTFA